LRLGKRLAHAEAVEQGRVKVAELGQVVLETPDVDAG
jgi:hypothetical protein